MQKHSRKLLVIIAEAAIERPLVADARRLGAMGYTVNEVHGGGAGGERSGEWEAERSVKLQVVCTEEAADRIAEHVLERYGRHYGLVVYLSDVQVFRSEKF
ncbi:MAG TPA: transcriptional regulator [Quisquiliibacterium sp.]|jgi:nitrogen regulatory protein P-II 2|nr:transcriptional regulator [Quisquiliibacterium sp.]